jgi:hypothetical protein
MAQARELGLGLAVVKHTEAFQVDSALHVETHLFNVEFAKNDHEHEIRKRRLLRLVMVILSDVSRS